MIGGGFLTTHLQTKGDEDYIGAYKKMEFASSERFEELLGQMSDRKSHSFQELFTIFTKGFDGDSAEKIVGEEGSFATDIGNFVYTFHEAVLSFIFDTLVYDSGNTEKILERDNPTHQIPRDGDKRVFREFVPHIENYIEDVTSLKKAEDKVQITKNFFDEFVGNSEEIEIVGWHQNKAKRKLKSDITERYLKPVGSEQLEVID